MVTVTPSRKSPAGIRRSPQRSSGNATACQIIPEIPTYGQYYVYSSGPKVSHADRSKHKTPIHRRASGCHAAHSNNIRTKGAHEFYNMMWDTRVYRGNTNTTFDKAELERYKSKRHEDDALIAKKRKFPRNSRLGGIVRPTTLPEDQYESPNGEKLGFGDMGIQTEQYLEEITSEVSMKDMCTQVDEVKNTPERLLKPFMTGVSEKVQTDPMISYPLNAIMEPLRKSISDKVIQQSLVETCEEYELETIRKEKRAYIQWRRDQLYKMKRDADAQRAVAEERILSLIRREKEALVESQAEIRLGAVLFSSGCIAGMMPITFDVLKLDGYLRKDGAQDIKDFLTPWMNCEIAAYYGQRKNMCRKLLDDLIHNVTGVREAEVAEDLNTVAHAVDIPRDEDTTETRTFSVNSKDWYYNNQYRNSLYASEEG